MQVFALLTNEDKIAVLEAEPPFEVASEGHVVLQDGTTAYLDIEAPKMQLIKRLLKKREAIQAQITAARGLTKGAVIKANEA